MGWRPKQTFLQRRLTDRKRPIFLFLCQYHAILTAETQSHIQAAFLLLVLLLFPHHLQLLSLLKSWTFQSHLWGLESTSSKFLLMLLFDPLIYMYFLFFFLTVPNGMWNLSFQTRVEPHHLHRKCRFLTTGLPEKSSLVLNVFNGI